MPARSVDDAVRRRVVLVAVLLVLALGVTLLGAARWTGARWHVTAATPAAENVTAVGPTGTETPDALSLLRGDDTGARLFAWILVGLAAAVVVVAVVLLARRWVARRPAPAGPLAVPEVVTLAEEPEPTPDVERVKRGFERAFAELAASRPPSDAIVAAWLGLEEAAQDAGISRRPSETPTELTSRLLTALDVDPDASTTLLDLYQRVRFGGREASAADVATAQRCLETMTSGWQRGSRWAR